MDTGDSRGLDEEQWMRSRGDSTCLDNRQRVVRMDSLMQYSRW